MTKSDQILQDLLDKYVVYTEHQNAKIDILRYAVALEKEIRESVDNISITK